MAIEGQEDGVQSYCLHSGTLEGSPEIPITASEFHQLKADKALLYRALLLEEKYDLVVKSYTEIESVTMEASLGGLVYGLSTEYEFYETHSTLNLRLVAFLSIISTLKGFLKRSESNCLRQGASFKACHAGLFSAEYDSHFEYKFMEGLRNLTQHSGFGLHGITSGRHRTDEGKLRYKTQLKVNRQALVEDGLIKPSVLNECPETVDLLRCVRIYMECVSNVQDKIRSEYDRGVSEAWNRIEAAVRRYYEPLAHSSDYCVAFEKRADQIVNKVELSTRYETAVRQKLIRKNRKLVNLQHRFLTTELFEEDGKIL